MNNIPNVEEYWLDDDMASSAFNLDYLQDVDFSLIDNDLSELK